MEGFLEAKNRLKSVQPKVREFNALDAITVGESFIYFICDIISTSTLQQSLMILEAFKTTA